jgi:hypothetical protein
MAAAPLRRSLLLLGLALVFAADAAAQIDPTWDHQKAYLLALSNPPSTSASVRLRDRFGEVTTNLSTLGWFSSPAERTDLANGQTWPIHDAHTHFMWWRLEEETMDATVQTIDPLSPQTLSILRSRFLVDPALASDVFGEPPGGNHYKAYDVQGEQLNHEVTIVDENGTWTGTVTFPFFFLTPVDEENVGTGQLFPIVDPTRSFVCYQVEPPVTTPYGAFVRDQFFLGTIQFFQAKLLCMPAVVAGATAARPATWGRLKSLYR